MQDNIEKCQNKKRKKKKKKKHRLISWQNPVKVKQEGHDGPKSLTWV